jgi:hypothetical protein
MCRPALWGSSWSFLHEAEMKQMLEGLACQSSDQPLWHKEGKEGTEKQKEQLWAKDVALLGWLENKETKNYNPTVINASLLLHKRKKKSHKWDWFL